MKNQNYRAVEATAEMGKFAFEFYSENLSALHHGPISEADFCSGFGRFDPDEQNFIILAENVPVAWLKVNGLQGHGCGWISMLAVAPDSKRRGVGSFAVDFACELIAQKGFEKAGLHTTEDNTAAIGLYTKCGFVEIGKRKEKSYADGANLGELTMEKQL